MTDHHMPRDEPRSLSYLLDEYASSHRNPTNIAIHAVAVPLITWTALALISRIPIPPAIDVVPGLGWSMYAAAAAIVYYLRLSPVLAIAMMPVAVAMLGAVLAYPADASLRLSAFAFLIFAMAWMLQFWGHRIEGKRPSFFRDVQFLLIGPAWLMTYVLRALRIGY